MIEVNLDAPLIFMSSLACFLMACFLCCHFVFLIVVYKLLNNDYILNGVRLTSEVWLQGCQKLVNKIALYCFARTAMKRFKGHFIATDQSSTIILPKRGRPRQAPSWPIALLSRRYLVIPYCTWTRSSPTDVVELL